MTVLVAINHFLPGYKAGGPTRSIANLIATPGTAIRWSLVTSDRDYGSDVPYQSVQVESFAAYNGIECLYINQQKLGLLAWYKILSRGKYNWLYLNSLWNLRYSLLPLIASMICTPRPQVMLAPRGELGHGALSKSRIPKRIALSILRVFRVYRRVTWHATNEQESLAIRRKIDESATVRIMSNVPVSPARVVPENPLPQRNRFVCIARITYMKNQLWLLQLLRSVRSAIVLDLYGPLEDPEYWTRCTEVIKLLPSHVLVNYKGPVEPQRIKSLLSSYAYFILPTRGENYGHAIAEALGVGVPVVISDQTPWRRLDEVGAGYDLSLDNPDSWIQRLSELASLGDPAYSVMQENALALASGRYEEHEWGSEISQLFSQSDDEINRKP